MKNKILLIYLLLLILAGCNTTTPQDPVEEKKTISVENVNENDLK